MVNQSEKWTCQTVLVCTRRKDIFIFQIVNRYGKLNTINSFFNCFIILHFFQKTFQSAFGQINMRDCRVETVDHVSDSDSEERDSNQPPTIALHPSHQGPPTYLLMSSKQEKV